MIRFENGQFEIAIATYKRPEYVGAWLEYCYDACIDRNISLSIYDSSPDSSTKDIIMQFVSYKHANLAYHHVNEETIIGYKPMIPLMESKSEYLWISGDSRYHDFNELDEKVFPYIQKRLIDYICFNTSNNYQIPDKEYSDLGEMLHDVFIPSTCIGLSIYRTEIFSPLKTNKKMLSSYNSLFSNNFGFSWLGYFYNLYALGEYKTLLVNIKTNLLLKDQKKTQSWAKRFYGCWANDLCQIIDNIPDRYKGKDAIPKNTWKIMGLEAIPYCYISRKSGDLNKKKYKDMEKEGLIERITDNPQRIRFFACAPMFIIECLYTIYRACHHEKR